MDDETKRPRRFASIQLRQLPNNSSRRQQFTTKFSLKYLKHLNLLIASSSANLTARSQNQLATNQNQHLPIQSLPNRTTTACHQSNQTRLVDLRAKNSIERHERQMGRRKKKPQNAPVITIFTHSIALLLLLSAIFPLFGFNWSFLRAAVGLLLFRCLKTQPSDSLSSYGSDSFRPLWPTDSRAIGREEAYWISDSIIIRLIRTKDGRSQAEPIVWVMWTLFISIIFVGRPSRSICVTKQQATSRERKK